MAEKQNFYYELGKKTGAKTPEKMQSGLQSLVGSIDKTVSGMLTASKAKTAALMTAMPNGVEIEKLDERMRGQVNEFLLKNKGSYVDATRVLASGLSPNDPRYMKAVEIINGVTTRFQTLSNSLENIATIRQNALDNPDNYGSNVTDERALLHNKWANGDNDELKLNEDGTYNFTAANGLDSKVSDYKGPNGKTFGGKQAYLAISKDIQVQAKIEGQSWGNLSEDYRATLDVAYDSMSQDEALDQAFQDREFVGILEQETGLEENYLKNNPVNMVEGGNDYDVIERYKEYNMEQLEQRYNEAPKYKKPDIKYTSAYYSQLNEENKIVQGLKQEQEDFVEDYKNLRNFENFWESAKRNNGYKDGQEAQAAFDDRGGEVTLQYLQNVMPNGRFELETRGQGKKTVHMIYILKTESDGTTKRELIQNVSFNKQLDIRNYRSLLKEFGIIG